MPATVKSPKRPGSTAVRFGNHPKPMPREKLVSRPYQETQRIVVDRDDPFQSLLVGTFNMNEGVVETPRGTVTRPNTPATIFADEPVSAPREPVRLSAKVDLELDRVGQLAEKLKELASTPAFVPIPTPTPAPAAPVASALPVEVLKQARKSARDAWCAVVLMGIFIIGGIAWTSGRLDSAEKRIAELLDQLKIEQTSSAALRVENQQAFQELNDVKGKLQALQYQNEQQTH
jgi:hypothetical protein